MEQHGVVLGPTDTYPNTSPEKGDVVESILEDLFNRSVFENSLDMMPSKYLCIEIREVTSDLLSPVKERHNERKVWSRAEADASNVFARRLDVDAKDPAVAYMAVDERPYVFDIGFNPYLTVRSADFREGRLTLGFD